MQDLADAFMLEDDEGRNTPDEYMGEIDYDMTEVVAMEEELSPREIEMGDIMLTEEGFNNANEDLEREDFEMRETIEEVFLKAEEIEEEDDDIYEEELSVFDKLDLELGDIVSKHGITQRGYNDIVDNINRRLSAIEGQYKDMKLTPARSGYRTKKLSDRTCVLEPERYDVCQNVHHMFYDSNQSTCACLLNNERFQDNQEIPGSGTR
ncbi:hypothetical protein INT48_000221 [Thamnidium elegans]|uniref:Uncharacterized protein n=1 Tax=Thamnidium elegans TaxID=101142 RepID=A0A8H7VRV3_9FUNG|nr:hypothetical protein INT48_000221 [Thamnidium elegans]